MQNDSTPEQTSLSVKVFQQLIDAMYSTKKETEVAKKAHSEAHAKYDELRRTVLKHLDSNEMDRFEGSNCKVTRVMKCSAKVPKDIEAKQKLFSWLKESYGADVLLSMTTINANTFSSFYNKEDEAAAARGDIDFEIPGVDEPTPYYDLRVTKK